MTRLPYFVGKSVGHQIEAGAGADFVQGQEKPRQTRDFQQAGVKRGRAGSFIGLRRSREPVKKPGVMAADHVGHDRRQPFRIGMWRIVIDQTPVGLFQHQRMETAAQA